MEKKVIIILVGLTLFLILLPAGLTNKNLLTNNTINELVISNVEYLLDQKQLLEDHFTNIHSRIWVAQSFKPSISPLTKLLVKVQKPVVIEDDLEISVRKNLNENELTYIRIPSENIPYFNFWVEVDIPDIEVDIDDTYYIIIRTASPTGKSYRWYHKYNETGDPYLRGKLWVSNDFGNEWDLIENMGDFADTAFQTFSYKSKDDLHCIGYLNWTDIQPGSIVTGSFSVQNIGTPFSYLSWEISNWPSWGIWTFNPSFGDNLQPENGPQNIQISMKSPNSTISEEYKGEILIINKNNNSDYCIIDTLLATPEKIEKLTNEKPLFFLKYFQLFKFFKFN